MNHVKQKNPQECSLRWKNNLFRFTYFSQLYHYTYQMCKKKRGSMLPSHTRSHSDSSEKAAFFSATLRRGITRVFFPLAVTLVSDFPAADNPCCQFSSSTSSASKSSKVKFNLQVTRKFINGYWQLFVSGSIGHTSLLKPWQNKKCQTFIGMLVF